MVMRQEQDRQKSASRTPTVFRKGDMVVIQVPLRTEEEAESLLQVFRKPSGGRALRSFITDVHSPNEALNAKRDRKGLLQPQVPILLIAELDALAARLGVSRTELLKVRLGKWISHRGKRRPRRIVTSEGRRFRRPARAFLEMGRGFANSDKRRQLPFDAGKAKQSIERLIKDCNMNKSEFFGALCQDIIKRPPPRLEKNILTGFERTTKSAASEETSALGLVS